MYQFYIGVSRWIVAGMIVMASMQTVVWAQIVVDPQAAQGQRPHIAAPVKDVPVLHIAPPNAAGVSHNRYQQFNVDVQGVILANNATPARTTYSGVMVPANTQLGAGKEARVIVSEVTGSHPSALNGNIEVVGKNADVVVSNPNGITINGLGFVHADRGVVTTGVPRWDATGNLAALRVSNGAIEIKGVGLNGKNNARVDLIARSVRVNGKIWGNAVNVITGSNVVHYDDLDVDIEDNAQGRPTVAIDVAELGGMYAKKIKLVGTEAGLGVHNDSHVVSEKNDYQLKIDGNIVLYPQKDGMHLKVLGDGEYVALKEEVH